MNSHLEDTTSIPGQEQSRASAPAGCHRVGSTEDKPVPFCALALSFSVGTEESQPDAEKGQSHPGFELKSRR